MKPATLDRPAVGDSIPLPPRRHFLAGLRARIERRLLNYLLRRASPLFLPVAKPRRIKVFLMGDDGSVFLPQADWQITAEQWAEMSKFTAVTLAVDVEEENGRTVSSWAHLPPENPVTPH